MRFNLVDQIVEMESGRRLRALKNLTLGEEYLGDHFPGFPVMPGVLMLHTLVEAGAWLWRATDGFTHSVTVLREVRGVKYGTFMEPGRQMVVTVELQELGGGLATFKGKGEADGQSTVSAKVVLAAYNLRDRSPGLAAVDERLTAHLKERYELLTRRLAGAKKDKPEGGTMRLKDQVAIVTGGSRGIGRGIAVALAREGARVAVVYRGSQAAAEEVVAEITAAGGTAKVFAADVAELAQVEACVKLVEEQLGPVDILVNSAGVIHDDLFVRLEPEGWDKVMRTNVGGTYNFCKCVAFAMMRKRSGRIINISSVAATHVNPGQTNYAASKGAINSFTKALAVELAPRGVTVNAIAPGFIETDMSAAVRNKAGDLIKKMIPMRRIGAPDDIARVAVFLAGPDSAYMTGQILTVDGGLSLGAH